MGIRVFDDVALDRERQFSMEGIIVRRVDRADDLLDAAHDLMLRVFDPAVVDPKSVYVDAVTDSSTAFRDFPPIFFAALFVDGDDELLVGFISSDLMPFGKAEDRGLHLAIGNVVTSSKAKELGLRGIGTTLWQVALDEANREAARTNWTLAYSSAEAEPASLGFWAKRGYKWPKGIKYFQPPLEFDDQGVPAYKEVAETLVIHPLASSPSQIEVRALREIIESIYWNWAIRPWIRTLDSTALDRAKTFVLERILNRTLESFPKEGTSIPLVEIPTSPPQ